MAARRASTVGRRKHGVPAGARSSRVRAERAVSCNMAQKPTRRPYNDNAVAESQARDISVAHDGRTLFAACWRYRAPITSRSFFLMASPYQSCLLRSVSVIIQWTRRNQQQPAPRGLWTTLSNHFNELFLIKHWRSIQQSLV